jgi:putative methionine-R-sulfoxide reductase with GAF domain
LKTYRPARELLAQIEKVLSENKPAFGCSPLDRVIGILSEGRHYSWVGIYLTVGDKEQQLLGGSGDARLNTTLPQSRSAMLVTMKLGSREIGVLAAESDKQFPFGPEDRVLLENVANVLARFLTGRGKYLVRSAREKASASNPGVPSRRPQSTSRNHRTAAAVGEK